MNPNAKYPSDDGRPISMPPASQLLCRVELTLYEAWALAGQAEDGGAPEALLAPWWQALAPHLGACDKPNDAWADTRVPFCPRAALALCQYALISPGVLLSADTVGELVERAMQAGNDAIRRMTRENREQIHALWLKKSGQMSIAEFGDYLAPRVGMDPARVRLEVELYYRFAAKGGKP